MSLLMFSVIRLLTVISCFNYTGPTHQRIKPSACESPMLLLLGGLGLPTFLLGLAQVYLEQVCGQGFFTY